MFIVFRPDCPNLSGGESRNKPNTGRARRCVPHLRTIGLATAGRAFQEVNPRMIFFWQVAHEFEVVRTGNDRNAVVVEMRVRPLWGRQVYKSQI